MGSEGVSCVCLMFMCVCSASIRVWMSSDRVPSPQAQASVNGCRCSMVCFFLAFGRAKVRAKHAWKPAGSKSKHLCFFVFWGLDRM